MNKTQLEPQELKVELEYPVRDPDGQIMYVTPVWVFIHMYKGFDEWSREEQGRLLNSMYPEASYVKKWEFTGKGKICKW